MWRTFWIVAGLAGAVIGGLTWHATTQATFLFHHPRTKGVRVEIDRRTGAAVVIRPVSAAKSEPSPGARPRAVAAATLHDFGTMDPLTMGRHEFVIRNEGDAPLKLRVGPTTCKCTVSGLAQSEVAPGGFTKVSLEWNTGRHERYEHAATIFTNDLAHRSLELRVAGNVRMLIGCDEPQIVLAGLDPTSPTVVERLIYSQTLAGFTIAQLDSRLAGLEWTAEPAGSDTEQRLSATYAQKLRITLPAEMPRYFSDTLRLTIQPGGENAEPLSLELPLSGSVARRLAFYGPQIDSAGVIELGDVQQGSGTRAQLLAKVRDAELSLPAAKVEAFPAFLRARLEPLADKPGLYRLTVELPADAPPCQYQGEPIGRLRIDTGHPRIGTVQLQVTFAVVPRRQF